MADVTQALTSSVGSPVGQPAADADLAARRERELQAQQPVAPSPAARADVSTYAGRSAANKFAGGPTTDADIAAAQEAARDAGAPFVSNAQVAEAAAKARGTPSFDTVTDALYTAHVQRPLEQQEVHEAVASAIDAARDANVDPWALVLAALMEAQKGKEADKGIALSFIKMYNIMGKKMADYSSYMLGVQQQLDGKMAAEKDDKKKPNVEVVMKQQLDFNPESMTSLTTAGEMRAKDNAAGKSDKDNTVTASSLQQRITLFGQQREQLSKMSDRWTQNYNNDMDQRNQLATQISQLLKDMFTVSQRISSNL